MTLAASTGWAAVGGAFIVAGYASNRESAYRNLMATPESLKNLYSKTTNSAPTKLQFDASSTQNCSLFDVSRGEVGRLPISFEDSSEFALAYGIHDKDKDTVRTNFVAEADVDAYEKVPIRVVLSGCYQVVRRCACQLLWRPYRRSDVCLFKQGRLPSTGGDCGVGRAE